MSSSEPSALDRLHATWDGLAAADPFWAVLSSAEHRLGGWDPERFYATGREEIDTLVAELATLGIAVERGTALDFGCGVGRLTRALAGHFATVVGVDLSARMIDLARELSPEPNVRYLVNRAENLALLADGSVDFVYTGRVLQHVPPALAERYLAEFVRVLAPGGLAVFQIPSAIRGGRAEDAALPAAAYQARLAVDAAPTTLPAGAGAELVVTVTNTSPLPWPGVAELGLYQLRVGNHWRHADGRLSQLDDGRTPLVHPLAAGESCTLPLRLLAPTEPGEYELELDLVQELVTWFADRGSPTVRFPVEVLPAPTTPATAEVATADPHAIEMHTLSRERVAEVVAAARGEIVHRRADGFAGPEWESTTYFVRKPRSKFARLWRRLVGAPSRTAIGLAALVLTACAPSPPPATPHHGYRGANVLLISIDTLRADRLSVYGYERPTSPNLERFAAEGVVFDRFYYNGGGTLPSHMTMMTSLYPGTHGLHPSRTKSLEPERVTLAEVFQTAGYATAGFADVGYMQAKWGFDQGFDVYDDRGHKFAGILPRAHEWLEKQRTQTPEQPFFLFLHTYDVHSNSRRLPYECPGDYPFRYTGGPHPRFDGCRGGRCASDLLAHANVAFRAGRLVPDELFTPDELTFVSALYDGCINYVDDKIAEILGWLEALGVADDTLVLITSDHGEEFLEHGQLLHDQGGYEELAHIPLLLRLPDRAHGGTRVRYLAEMVDLLPTVLDLVGLPPPGDAQGSSLVPSFRDGRAVTTAVHMYSILRTERYKYFKDEKQLFDLVFDPRERGNLFRVSRWRATRLDRQVRRIIREDFRAADAFSARATAAQPALLTPEEASRLKSLGYLQ